MTNDAPTPTADPENKARIEKSEAIQKSDQDKALAEIAERLLGVRPEHADPIYTQHPVMAGVLRQALRDAYDRGAAMVAAKMLQSILDGRRGKG